MDERIIEIQNHYGLKAQSQKCVEELDELINALFRGNLNIIIEEIADVRIMLAQIENLRGIVLDVDEMIDYKLNRTIERIRKEGDDS